MAWQRSLCGSLIGLAYFACQSSKPDIRYPLTVVPENVPVVLVWQDASQVTICNPGDRRREKCTLLRVPERHPEAHRENEKCHLEIVQGTLAPSVTAAKVVLKADQKTQIIDEWTPAASLEADAFFSFAAWSPAKNVLVVAHVISFLGDVPTSRIVSANFLAVHNCQLDAGNMGIKPL